jgi:hypothetical protein
VGPDRPKPGGDGTTTWKASAGSPPWARVAERPDEVEELHHRAGPAVGQDQWQGIGLGGADVEEVDVVPVELGGELGKELSLASWARQS